MGSDFEKKLSEKYCPRFGQIAVELNIITAEQLKAALNEQIDDDVSDMPHRLIGRILFEKGWITPDQIDMVLERLFKNGQ
ncbi:MAG TPA: hypothetical protein ENG95_07450 [Nitrospirae bacterium]|nr:hypothetical protein BMS3Abin10_01213 [bacterium BMS3Abin10]GBE38431.1 hypothetical protein BMS3Bbin08_01037 [bacterium BMS3Bbin08]HDH00503.1 hypothetical protein [Nitrospirota bacterium]HDH51388.1 hypothetical protein [Nitrospirota bacterium]HDO26462.1 hypothetical protein [Nitrospirota bacterium]